MCIELGTLSRASRSELTDLLDGALAELESRLQALQVSGLGRQPGPIVQVYKNATGSYKDSASRPWRQGAYVKSDSRTSTAARRASMRAGIAERTPIAATTHRHVQASQSADGVVARDP